MIPIIITHFDLIRLGTGAWIVIAGDEWSTLFENPVRHQPAEENQPTEQIPNAF